MKDDMGEYLAWLQGAVATEVAPEFRGEVQRVLSAIADVQSKWDEDCVRQRGGVLAGEYGHWCPEWDDLPVDDSTPEWPCACADSLTGTVVSVIPGSLSRSDLAAAKERISPSPRIEEDE